MERKVQGLVRSGLAVTLASTLMVPTTALAQGSDDADAQTPADSSQAADGGAQDAGQSSDGATDAGSEKVTIIVQLEDGGTEGTTLLSNLMGTQAKDRHSYFKNEIKKIASEKNGGADQGGIQLFSTDEGASDDASVDEVHDYYNVIDGFAVKAPANTLEDIKALDGVKNAFVEHEYSIPADQADAGAALKNQASLDVTQADEVDQKGDGQVIAIIDTGLDTSHEAFSGDLDDSKVALSKDAAEKARQSMHSGGQNGAYVSEKIPFVYDYADGDNNVNPSSVSGMEHGTHVAGIAAANGGSQIRGTAPDAQIAMMKVAADQNGGIYDSALIAAMDDVPALGATSVNISIGADAGFSDEGAGTYTDAINRLQDKGITVNVAEGNSYSSALKNQSGKNLPYATDPDSSMASTPATVSGAVAVASMNTDKIEVSEAGKATLTASDGTQLDYYEAKDRRAPRCRTSSQV